MKAIKDMEMPGSPAEAPEEGEEFDFGFEDEESGEESPTDLAGISDDDLIAEMKKRGFDVEDEVEEDVDEEAPEMEEMEEPIV